MTDPRDSDADFTPCYGCDSDASCEEGPSLTNRRRVLGALAVGGSLAIAGCQGLLASPDEYEIRGRDDVYDVTFDDEETIQIRGSQTVLRTAEAEGISLPFDCRAGFCGVCLSQADDDANEAVHMAVNDFDPLTDEAVEEGYFLPCTSQPRSDFAVTSGISPDELDEFAPEDEEDDDVDEPDDVGTRHPIRYVNEGWIIPVGEEQDLLRAAEDAGLEELPYSCREGRCGVCLSQIDGDATELVEHVSIEYDPLDEDALEEGYVLTCTAQPRGEFELETDRAGEL